MLYVIVFVVLVVSSCETSQDHDRLYNDIFQDYNKHTFPTLNTTGKIHVGVNIMISSLNKFEELSGRLSVTLLFCFVWREERITWNSSGYGGLSSLIVDPKQMWRPQLYVLQPANILLPIGYTSPMLRLYHNGKVSWSPAEVIELTCSLNVADFPFDTQRCLMTIAGWEYDKHELMLHSISSYLNTNLYIGHSHWELLQSPFTDGILGGDSDGPSCVNLTLVLRRKSEFFIVYIIVPVTFLGFINDLVFLIPASSGERSSVAITTFLSFVVYMGIIDDIVPESSSPIAHIYYHVLFLMLYSSCIMCLCIVSQRIYDREGNVPFFLRCLMCKCYSVHHNEQQANQPRHVGRFPNVEDTGRLKSRFLEPGHVTWKTVGKAFDTLCFVTVLLAFCTFNAFSVYMTYPAIGFTRGDNITQHLFKDSI